MLKDNRDEVRRVFNACCSTSAPDEVEIILERECQGDDALRKAVGNLLDAERRHGAHLEGSPNSLLNDASGDDYPRTHAVPSDEEDAGKFIHGYKLLQKIGEGGFGVVYMAQQTKPVRRRVALKVIKPGMDSKEVVARFEAERQALAMMDHPHVAKVLDAGTTENGRPYFVMELVHGTKITEFCDNQRLTTDQRLRLFVDVCRAVQHAHIKGIIHRDLKPSNILVTMDDDRPIPKVIDFCVSKALSQSLTDQTMFTRYGQIVGTPLYMSPEQAQFAAHDIDVRSDVYSLGVVLYELLTGNTPFDRDELMRSGFDEMQRMLREVEPPRPSARISTLCAEMISTVSDKRQADPRRLSSSLAGELDWIVMKSLEKDRSRRYESARDLAADIQRYLEDEAVKARPPSAGYRLRKFVRRHRAALTTVSIVALALVVGFSVAVWQAVVATQERNRTAEQRDRALAAEQVAEAVNEFLNEDLLAQANLENQPNPNVKLHTVIDQAAVKLETRFEDQPLIEAEIRQTLAEAYESLGAFANARKHIERVLAICERELGSDDPKTFDALRLRARLFAKLGRYRHAEQEIDRLIQIARNSLSKDELARLEVEAAGILLLNGRYSESIEIADAAVQRLHSNPNELSKLAIRARLQLSQSLHENGEFVRAKSVLESILLDSAQSLGENHPVTLSVKFQAAKQLCEEGYYREAEIQFRHILQQRIERLGEHHPHTIESRHGIAFVLWRQSRFQESLSMAEMCLPVAEQYLGPSHLGTLRFLDLVGACQSNLNLFAEAQKAEELRMKRTRDSLGESHPDLIISLNNLSRTLGEKGEWQEALCLLNESRNLAKVNLGETHPLTLSVDKNLSEMARLNGNHEQAVDVLQRTLAVEDEALDNLHPDRIRTLRLLGSVYLQMGDAQQADHYLRQAADCLESRYGEDSLQYALHIEPVVRHLLSVGATDEAEARSRKAIKTLEEKLDGDDLRLLTLSELLGDVLSQRGEYEKARQQFQSVFERLKVSEARSNIRTQLVACRLGTMLSNVGEYESAISTIELAIGVLESQVGRDSLLTRSAQLDLALAYYHAQRFEESRDLLEEILPFRERAMPEHQDTDLVRDLLSRIYISTEEYAKSVEISRERFEINREHYGLKHDLTLKSANNVALHLRKAGRPMEVLSFCEQWVPALESNAGDINEFLLTMRANWSLAYKVLADSKGLSTEQWSAWSGLVRDTQQLHLKIEGIAGENASYYSNLLKTTLMGHAEQLVLNEEFAQALKVLSEISEVNLNQRQAECVIALHLYLDERESSAKLSQQLWERAQKEEEPFAKSRWIVSALLPLHHGLSADEIVEFMKPTVAENNGNFPRLALGLARYRSGHFKEAADTAVLNDQAAGWIRPISFLVHAMACAKSGDADSAKKSFDEAVTRMTAIAPTRTTGVELKDSEPPRWTLWCLYQGLQREAAEVLGIEIPKPLAESASDK